MRYKLEKTQSEHKDSVREIESLKEERNKL